MRKANFIVWMVVATCLLIAPATSGQSGNPPNSATGGRQGSERRTSADLKVLLRKYLAASNRHDLSTLRAMTAEDAVWQLGPELLVGRDTVLAPNACDAGANTRLKWSHITVSGNTVDFELVERNDILRSLRVRELRHYVRFTFQDGLVTRKEERKPATGIEVLNANGARFYKWLREVHPEAMPKLLAADGKFIYSRESCKLMAELAAGWAGFQH